MLAVTLFLCFLALTSASNPDLGYPGWSCPANLMAKSAAVPTSAHAVRMADFNVIAALGDSLTAANGAGAPKGDALGVIIQYRGLAFQIGGDNSLDQHVTLANIMKKFNPNIFGYSTGTGGANVWENSRLNQAVPGAESIDIITQARTLVQLMQTHPDVDLKNDWKLVNIFIGANDMCVYCKYNTTDHVSGDLFKQHLIDAVKILKDNLPRTIVSMTGMMDMGMLRTIDKKKYFCDGLHMFECPCEKDKTFTDQDISTACHTYMDAEKQIQDSGMFDTSDDFTLVVQPFFNDITTPPLNANGEPDLTWFAPDCFHFSQLGHANVAKHLWNNINQPVWAKQTSVNLSDPTIPLNCPDASCPFFRTTKNSVNCLIYQ